MVRLIFSNITLTLYLLVIHYVCILEREEKEDEEIQVMKRLSADDQRRLNVVEARMKGVASGLSEDAEYEDMGGLEGEAEELRNRINERTAKINGYLERR